jgi:hypothetical protein
VRARGRDRTGSLWGADAGWVDGGRGVGADRGVRSGGGTGSESNCARELV